ncbi:reverse transcriptase domain-containing protein [Tanacetum coccineum]|uniref:Reverse transcriptase domain-containing protein n=1 Tax=Tanacetum coccineum TaxID=301880 RepID=A0ABQ4Z756_9ASTR
MGSPKTAHYRLYLFPHSLTHHATAWFDRLPRNSITTFEQMAKMFLRKYFPPSMVMKLRKEITNFRQRPDESLFEAWENVNKASIDRCPKSQHVTVTPNRYVPITANFRPSSESSSFVTSSSDSEFVALKAEMAEINKQLNEIVYFDADPRIPLILKRPFLKTGRALIDVYAGELTLRVGNKAVTFNLDQTSRYSSNYDDISVNRIDVIDVACEECSQEVIGFSVNSDFLLEETDAFLAIEDEPISPEPMLSDSYYDSEGDILLLEEFLNDDPLSPPLPPQELKVVEPKNEKSSIDEPPEVELKDLPPHLEYAF